MHFRNYRKTTLTQARRLTSQDYWERNGIIETIHGPASFQPGDYLGRDTIDEYPIGHTTLEKNYQKVSEEDAEGFAEYLPLDIREAVQMPNAFEAGGVQGKPGDYLVKNGARNWPVNQGIFESSYVLIESEKS